ncbi:MAG: S41 family peptidase [Kiritimatiellia bacterium]|jgi:carboxyl-terminal processing protease
MKKLIRPLLAAFIVGAAVVAPAEPSSPASAAESPYGEIRAFTEALVLILNRHVEKTSFKDLTYAAIDGMLAAMDPFSNYLRVDDLKAYEEDSEGRFTGVGIVSSEIDGKWVINYPMPGSPAFCAGIRAFDEIVAVNGVRAEGPVPMESIHGEAGTVVVLTIRRVGERDPFDVAIRRAAIDVPTVQSARILPEGIAYLYIAKFGEKTLAEFNQALSTLLEAKPCGFVLDLRDNPGGLVVEAGRMADAFLPMGRLVFRTKGRLPKEDNVAYVSETPRKIGDIPLAVIINAGAASAAEIVAAGIQENDAGTLVGERSFGKASIQTFFQLNSRPEEAVQLTTAYYYTPKGHLIHGNGIEPDIVVAQTPDEFRLATLKRLLATHPELCHPHDAEEVNAVVDAPLDAAIAYLQRVIATNAVATNATVKVEE